jgi:hypothetical protein
LICPSTLFLITTTLIGKLCLTAVMNSHPNWFSTVVRPFST